jgi:hypothetical protein
MRNALFCVPRPTIVPDSTFYKTNIANFHTKGNIVGYIYKRA